jgi:magnesium transporter
VSWTDLADPAPDELRRVATSLGMAATAVASILRAPGRPRLEVHEDTLLIVVKPVDYDDERETFGVTSLTMLLREDRLLTLHHADADVTDHVGEVERERGAAVAVNHLLDVTVEGYDAVLDGFEEDIDQVEGQVFAPERSNVAQRIYRLERQLLHLERGADALEPIIQRLEDEHPMAASALGMEHLRGLHDRASRVAERLEGQRDLLDSALQANLTQVSVQQNADSRRISAWVAILALPTTVAGIYGMNFEHMPELEWRFGYPAVLLFMAACCSFLFWRFKRAGWL